MAARTAWYLALGMIVVAAATGAFEAARSDQGGMFGLFALVALSALALIPALVRLRRTALLRADLAGWLASASALAGETEGEFLNRAVSAYRAGVGDGGQP